jgi:hypothetical protein
MIFGRDNGGVAAPVPTATVPVAPVTASRMARCMIAMLRDWMYALAAPTARCAISFH